jgi:hypothetical protein
MKAFIIILKGHEPSEAFGRVAMQSGKQVGWDVVGRQDTMLVKRHEAKTLKPPVITIVEN